MKKIKDNIDDNRCNLIKKQNTETYYNEIQARRNVVSFQRTKGYRRYDCLLDGRVVVTIKRRDCKSTDYPCYFLNKEKVQALKMGTPHSVVAVFFFEDCWFSVNLRQEFSEQVSDVYNPRKGNRRETSYVIFPSQGQFHHYRTVPTWSNADEWESVEEEKENSLF